MALIFKLARFLRHSHFREIQENNFQKTQRIITGWLVFAIGLRFFLNVYSSGYQFFQGNTFTAQAIAAFNLNFILFFWLLAPIIRGLKKPSANLLNLRFVMSPVKKQDYLVIQLYDFALCPSTLLLAGTSIVSFFPLWIFAFSWITFFSSLIYLVLLFCFSFLLSLIPQSLFTGFKLQGVSKILLVLIALLLLFSNPEFQWQTGQVNLILFVKKFLFRSSMAKDIYQDILSWTPAGWLVNSVMMKQPLLNILKLLGSSTAMILVMGILASQYPRFFIKHQHINGKKQIKKNKYTSFTRNTTGFIFLKSRFHQLINYPGTITGLLLYIFFVTYSLWVGNQNQMIYYIAAGITLSLIGSQFLNALGQDFHLISRFMLIPDWAKNEFKSRLQLLMIVHLPLAFGLGLSGLVLLKGMMGLNYLLYCLGFLMLIFSLGNFTSVLLFYPVEAHSSATQGLEKNSLIQAGLILLCYGLYSLELSLSNQALTGSLLFLIINIGLLVFMTQKAPKYLKTNLLFIEKETKSLHL